MFDLFAAIFLRATHQKGKVDASALYIDFSEILIDRAHRQAETTGETITHQQAHDIVHGPNQYCDGLSPAMYAAYEDEGYPRALLAVNEGVNTLLGHSLGEISIAQLSKVPENPFKKREMI